MHAEDPFDLGFVEGTFAAHQVGAGASFLGGLEEQLHRAAEFAFVILEQPRGAEQHGRVAIVAARVHLVIDFTAKRNVGLFVDRDRVVGVISIGDLVNWIITAHEETIGHLQSYIAGQYPG